MYDLETCGSRDICWPWLVVLSGCLYSAADWIGAAPQPQGGGPSATLFTLVDANKDGAVTREELKGTFDKWYTEWDTAKGNALTLEQVFVGLGSAFPPAPPAGGRGGAQPQNQTPRAEDVTAMMAALPDTAPVKPKQPRKVLVLARAAGFRPLVDPARGANDRRDRQEDRRLVDDHHLRRGRHQRRQSQAVRRDLSREHDRRSSSTTPNDAAATAARRKALLDFVRGGKGLAGIHAASDSYHRSSAQSAGGRGGAYQFSDPAGRDADGRRRSRTGDGRLSREEFTGLADTWYDRFDSGKTGTVARADFPQRFASLPPAAMPAPRGGGNGQAPATNLGPDTEVGTWPEFNKMIGGFFKFHWNDGQTITVKIDEPKHPINAPFKGNEYVIVDETYTFARDTYSRQNLKVLTSIDYAKMSADDKAKEQNPRPDGDYALSWIRREGKGRVFYEAHGHNEKIYAIKLLLEHITAGMQYVLGDLQADDSPSVKAGAK